MKHDSPDLPASRRRFVRQIAQSAAWLSAGALASRTAFAASPNPFAYDVGRLKRIDPQLIGWEEAGRRTIPGNTARRFTLGPDDTAYVATGTRILRLTPTGERPPLELGALVRCVAVAPDGALFAGLPDRIALFDASGRRQPDWAAPAPRSWISGIAVSETTVFAADSGQRLIWRYDRTGRILGRIGERDSARGLPGLVLPSPYLDVRLHADGLLRVNDPGRHRIELYTLDGALELFWGEPTAAIHGFCGCCNPIGLALLPDGRVVTCEKGLPRVKVYTATGTLDSVVAGPDDFPEQARLGASGGDSPRGGLDVAVDSRGHIHILDRATGELRRMQPKART